MTVGLQRIVNEKGNGKLAMQMGLGVVGAAYTQKSQATLNDTTPIAKLIEEAGAIVVSKDSPYTDITSLIDAWKKDPSKVNVGGGSSPGGPDHLLREVILQPYIRYDDEKFEGIARNDRTVAAGLEARYLLNQYVAAYAGYAFERRDTNALGRDFTSNVFTFGLRGQL